MKTIARSCLATLAALLALAPTAQAQIDATIPARVIKELDGAYKVEYRPTSDGKLASITQDMPLYVPLYTRQADVSLVEGIDFPWPRLANGKFAREKPGLSQVSLQEDGWMLAWGSRVLDLPPGEELEELPASLRRTVQTKIPIQWGSFSARRMQDAKEARSASRQEGVRPITLQVVPQGAPAAFKDAVTRVESYFNLWVSLNSQPVTILVDYIPGSAPAFTAQFFSPRNYLLITNLGLLTNALSSSEFQEALVYEEFASTSSYRFTLSGNPPGQLSTSVLLSPTMDQVVLGNPPPNESELPMVFVNSILPSGRTWDFMRADGIGMNQNDFEGVLAHEVVHALGFASPSITQVINNNAAYLSDLFRVGPGESQSGTFSFALRRIYTASDPKFVVLLGQEVSSQVAALNGGWDHWIPRAQNGNLEIGRMDPGVRLGEQLPYVLNSTDLRAVDIVGHEVSNFFFDAPGVVAQDQPLANANGVELNPTFAWSPGLVGERFVVALYNGPNPTTAILLGSSDLLNSNSYTFPFQLSPQTQYWWAVSAVNGAGAYALSEVRSFTTGSGCDSVDFNNDTFSPDSADIDDFLAVLAGGPSACSTFPTPGCNDIDFNNDTFAPDSCDLDSLITALSGGGCTPCGS